MKRKPRKDRLARYLDLYEVVKTNENIFNVKDIADHYKVSRQRGEQVVKTLNDPRIKELLHLRREIRREETYHTRLEKLKQLYWEKKNEAKGKQCQT